MNLLRIDSSARTNSVSRLLTATFTDAWRAQNPMGNVRELDLSRDPLPTITEEWSAAIGVDPSKQTREQRALLEASNALVQFLFEADQIVIGAPMYNFSVSAQLKAWIDQIVRPGRTVEYGPGGPKGLLVSKRVVVLTSRGGSYAHGATRAHLDYQEPYLRSVFEFIGLTDVTFIHAENQLRKGEAEQGRQSAIESIGDYLRRPA